MNIRTANETDMPALLKVEEDCFGAERFSPETVRAFLQRDDTFVLIAESKEDVVGSAMCLFSECERHGKIASIAVLRRCRRQGIGADILEECERLLNEKNLTKCSLEVETLNEPAIALYTSRGYEVKGVLQDFYGFGRHAYYMEKITPATGRSVKFRPS